MYKIVAEDTVPLFNFNTPEPGSESAVLVVNLYSKVAPPKFPSAP
jgi:hypothetical protein